MVLIIIRKACKRKKTFHISSYLNQRSFLKWHVFIRRARQVAKSGY